MIFCPTLISRQWKQMLFSDLGFIPLLEELIVVPQKVKETKYLGKPSISGVMCKHDLLMQTSRREVDYQGKMRLLYYLG